MKKEIALAALILGTSFTFTACTSKNSPKTNLSNSQLADEQNTNSAFDNTEITDSTSSSETTDSTPSSETTDSNSSAEGGNPDTAKYIEVTVAEDKYFYENHEISYDDLIKVFDELYENTVVKISDENATLKAYESLTKALEEREILFEAA